MDIYNTELLYNVEQFLVANGASNYLNYYLRSRYPLIASGTIKVIFAPIDDALVRLSDRVNKSLEETIRLREGMFILDNSLSPNPIDSFDPVQPLDPNLPRVSLYTAINGTTYGTKLADLKRLKSVTSKFFGNLYISVVDAFISTTHQLEQLRLVSQNTMNSEKYESPLVLVHIDSIETLRMLNGRYPEEKDVSYVGMDDAGFTEYPEENEFEGNASELMIKYPVWGTWLIIDKSRDIVLGRIMLDQPNPYSRGGWANRSEIYIWIKPEFRSGGIGTSAQILIYKSILPFVNTIIEVPALKGGPLAGGTSNIPYYWKGTLSLISSDNIASLLSGLKAGARIVSYITDNIEAPINAFYLDYPETRFTPDERKRIVSQSTNPNLPLLPNLKLIEQQLLDTRTRPAGLIALKLLTVRTLPTNLIEDDRDRILKQLGGVILEPVINASEYLRRYPQLQSNILQDRINQLVRIGDEDVYIIGDIVVKYYPRSVYTGNQEEPDEIQEDFDREIILGLEINKLNNGGFMRTIGYNDNKTCIIPETEVFPLCDYLYLEKIEGVTLRRYLRYNYCILSQFKAIMKHIIKSYKVAYDTLDFTHYDFHDNNVIINTNGLPVIIDFGTSHIKLPEGHIGDNHIIDGRYPDRSNWIHDFFKLLSFCALNTNMPSNGGFNPLYEEEQNNKIEALIRSVEQKLVLHVWADYQRAGNYFSRKRTYAPNSVRVISIEPMSEYISRIRNMVGNQDFVFTYGITDGIYRIEKETQKLAEATNYNRENLTNIHNYCIQLLKYFHPSMSTDWLINYRNNTDFRFSSFTIDAGKLARFDDFISYFDGIV